MDLATSPTCQSCRLYWQSVPPTRREEFLRRRKWFEFTLLNYLPSSHCISGRHSLSDNEGDDHADDDAEDNKEDNNKVNDDEVENNDYIITRPPSPIVKRNTRNERNAHLDVDDNTDDIDDDNIVERNSCEESNAHSDVADNADDDDDATITRRSLPLSRYEEFLQRRGWFATILLILTVTTTATTAKLTKTTMTLLLALYLPLISTELILAPILKIFS